MGISTMSKFWFEPNRRSWHLDRATGGGMWLTAGMHCLDRLTWLVGSRVRSVCAQFDTRLHNQAADDVGTVLLRYDNGASGIVVSTGYRTGAPKHTTELTCENGVVDIHYVTGVRIGRNERWQAVPGSASTEWLHEALVNEWLAFRDSLTQGIDPSVSGHEARHIMAAVFAAEESSRLKKEISVPK